MSLARLGEGATVDASGFTRTGSKGKTFRRMHNKSGSLAYTFETVEAPYSPDLIAELRDAPQAWLGERAEMSFSPGFLNENYLSRAPITVAQSVDSDRIEGFASLMPQGLGAASVDLVRICPDVPNGVVDDILVNLMEWTKNRGYTEFDFGMTLMSNTGARPHSRLSERTIYLVYNYGGRIYNLRRLRSYKEKFKSVWKFRYLTYTDMESLPIITASLSKLINRPEQYSVIALSTSEDEVPTPEMAINAN